jgi:diacylglycerol kinase family enzyme
MPKPFLVVNPRSGRGGDAPALAAAARERGIDVHLLAPGDDPAALARGASASASALGVAGGDGTMGAVAGAAIERGLPFVCVPFGTRNHFARDLGLDDPFEALSAFADGVSHAVDVGRIGDRVFVNNVSIGHYAQRLHGMRMRPLRLTIDDAPVRARVVLFANNAYRVDGVRERLDEGVLHLYVAHGLFRRLWDERVGERFAVGGVRRVAVDGEALEVEPPFEVAIEPGALRVLVPRERGVGSRA